MELVAERRHLASRVEALIELARRVRRDAREPLPQVPGYRVLRELGRGGMGTAYLARQERLAGRSDSPAALVCEIGAALARALVTVRAAGLLHRDVKPSNILLRRDGTPILSGFGLARETDATLSQPGQFVGTAATYAWSQIAGPAVTLTGADSAAPGFTASQVPKSQAERRGRPAAGSAGVGR